MAYQGAMGSWEVGEIVCQYKMIWTFIVPKHNITHSFGVLSYPADSIVTLEVII